jgi:predicted alpha/beta hydrolase
MFFMWHLMMPTLTQIVGYFPGRFLGLSEDLPYDVAMAWGRRRFRSSTINDHMHANFNQIASPALALMPEDDDFATHDALCRVKTMFPQIEFTELKLIVRHSTNQEIGHLGFFRRSSREYLWPYALEWLTEGHVPLQS